MSILSDSSTLVIVKQFIADPKAEFSQVLCPVQVKQEDGTFKEQSMPRPSGFTQKQQVILMLQILRETVFTEMTQADFASAFTVLYELANCSQFRQKLEAANLLAKSEGVKRSGPDAAMLAAKYCS